VINARRTFDHVANDTIRELIDMNFKFYKQINDDLQFGKSPMRPERHPGPTIDHPSRKRLES